MTLNGHYCADML